MAYVLGQYNKNIDSDNDIFMSAITSGTVDRRQGGTDQGVIGDQMYFYDECIKVDNLDSSKNYYFHGRIQRDKDSDQTFYIKLCYFDREENDSEQYIKTINVAKGSVADWVDVEFCFSPMIGFDCILFELQRVSSDYRNMVRYPKIAYQELSIINNLIGATSSGIASGNKFIKIGVQSRPGLLMCINGEEIRTSRTGIYELKNGIMTIPFFSVVNALEEGGTTMKNWMDEVSVEIAEIDDSSMTPEEKETAKKNISSRCFFNSTKKPRVIDSFTLDYLYRQD